GSRMRKRVARLARWLTLLAGTSSFFALAQDDAATYPNRPLRIVIGTPPGAAADTVARMTAEILSEHLKRNVIVESRPGGGGVIASTYAAKAQPDGYTLYQN